MAHREDTLSLPYDVHDGFKSGYDDLMRIDAVIRNGFQIRVTSAEHGSGRKRLENVIEFDRRARILFKEIVANMHRKEEDTFQPQSSVLFSTYERQLNQFVTAIGSEGLARQIALSLCREFNEQSFAVWAAQRFVIDRGHLTALVLDKMHCEIKHQSSSVNSLLPLCVALCKGSHIFFIRRFFALLPPLFNRVDCRIPLITALNSLLSACHHSILNNSSLTHLNSLIASLESTNDEIITLRKKIRLFTKNKEKLRIRERSSELFSSSVCDLVDLLDHFDCRPPFNLKEFLQRMSEIGSPQSQLVPLLNWSITVRSSMGAVIAARVIQSWHLPNINEYLLSWLMEQKPGKQKKENDRLIQSLCRIMCTLSLLGILKHDDIFSYVITRGVLHDWEEGTETSSWRRSLLISLPISDLSSPLHNQRTAVLLGYGSKEDVAEKRKEKEIFDRVVTYLNGQFSMRMSEWDALPSREEKNSSEEILNDVSSLSPYSVHRLAEMTANAYLGALNDALIGKRSVRMMNKRSKGSTINGEESTMESYLFLPRHSALNFVVELVSRSVDPTLLPRFTINVLPFLQSLSSFHHSLSLFSSSSAICLISHCFSSRLPLLVSGLWERIQKCVSHLLTTLCPLHWQTTVLQKFCSVSSPTGPVCAAKHVCLTQQGCHSLLERKLRSKVNTENELSSFASYMADVCLSSIEAKQELRDCVRRRMEERMSEEERSSFAHLVVLFCSKEVFDAERTARDMLELLKEVDGGDPEWYMEEIGRVTMEERRRKMEEMKIVNSCNRERALTALTVLRTLFACTGGTNQKKRGELQFVIEGRLGGLIEKDVVTVLVRMSSLTPGCVSRDALWILDRLLRQQSFKRELRKQMKGKTLILGLGEWKTVVNAVGAHRQKENGEGGKKEEKLLFSTLDEYTMASTVNETLLHMLTNSTNSEFLSSFSSQLYKTVFNLCSSHLQRVSLTPHIPAIFFERFLLQLTTTPYMENVTPSQRAIYRGVNLAIQGLLEAIGRVIVKKTAHEIKNGRLIHSSCWVSIIRIAWRYAQWEDRNQLLTAFYKYLQRTLTSSRSSSFPFILSLCVPLCKDDKNFPRQRKCIVLLFKAISSGIIRSGVQLQSCMGVISNILGKQFENVRLSAANAHRLHTETMLPIFEEKALNWNCNRGGIASLCNMTLPVARIAPIPRLNTCRKRGRKCLEIYRVRMPHPLTSITGRRKMMSSWKKRYQVRTTCLKEERRSNKETLPIGILRHVLVSTEGDEEEDWEEEEVKSKRR